MPAPTPITSYEITAYTRPDTFKLLGDHTKNIPYDRVMALYQDDGFFGTHLGDRNIVEYSQRRLSLPSVIGQRLLGAFEAMQSGDPMNCHKFGRLILGMYPSMNEPTTKFGNLTPVKELAPGATGIIGASGYGVPHTVGYGLGNESLQVMSAGGELGFASNASVIDFYSQIHPEREVNLYQLP